RRRARQPAVPEPGEPAGCGDVPVGYHGHAPELLITAADDDVAERLAELDRRLNQTRYVRLDDDAFVVAALDEHAEVAQRHRLDALLAAARDRHLPDRRPAAGGRHDPIGGEALVQQTRRLGEALLLGGKPEHGRDQGEVVAGGARRHREAGLAIVAGLQAGGAGVGPEQVVRVRHLERVVAEAGARRAGPAHHLGQAHELTREDATVVRTAQVRRLPLAGRDAMPALVGRG